MRLKVERLGRSVSGIFRFEFGREQLTSYDGLDLPRYFQFIGLNQRLRRSFREHQLGGDYGCAHLVLLVIVLLVVGALRLLRSLRTWPATWRAQVTLRSTFARFGIRATRSVSGSAGTSRSPSAG
jgi:hypothetical protein